jgi:3-hydroxybutyryl-CoA dehydrogenase
MKVGVVGLGAMGSGIAQLCVEAGIDTVGREVTMELAETARGRVAHFLTRKVEKGQIESFDSERLTLTTDLADLADCDIVIEAIVEELGAKQELFAELERICRADGVLATNTSALSVTEIASATSSPERVVGMHFFNPAPLMPLVEIVRAELTSDDAFERAYALGMQLGKHPIRCHDTPGFVVNRVLIPLLNDCVRVVDEARVSPEDLDAGMKHGAGWPMGPCALLDLVGIDVHVHASEALYDKLREPRMAPPPRLVAMRNAGLLGRKSGRGFYTYGWSFSMSPCRCRQTATSRPAPSTVDCWGSRSATSRRSSTRRSSCGSAPAAIASSMCSSPTKLPRIRSISASASTVASRICAPVLRPRASRCARRRRSSGARASCAGTRSGTASS